VNRGNGTTDEGLFQSFTGTLRKQPLSRGWPGQGLSPPPRRAGRRGLRVVPAGIPSSVGLPPQRDRLTWRPWCCVFVVNGESQRLFWHSASAATIAGEGWSGGIIGMDTETTAEWRARGREVLRFVRSSERRLSASLRLNDVTILAAADELGAATKVALAWLAANPCPDSKLGQQVARMLSNCAEVALTAQRLATEPDSNHTATNNRMGNLAAVISVDTPMLEAW
jgi:hypothetical protein